MSDVFRLIKNNVNSERGILKFTSYEIHDKNLKELFLGMVEALDNIENFMLNEIEEDYYEVEAVRSTYYFAYNRREECIEEIWYSNLKDEQILSGLPWSTNFKRLRHLLGLINGYNYVLEYIGNYQSWCLEDD